MKDIIITIIFILLMLTAVAAAYAQEAWFEAAEASGLGYEKEMRRPIETGKKEVKIDEEIFKEIESLSPVSNFEVRNYEAGGVAPAGALGMGGPGPIEPPLNLPDPPDSKCTGH
jgi:hypothetical protein